MKTFDTGAALLGLALCTAVPSAAQVEWTASRPDGHAPIGVMGDHTHARGEFMLSYRYMHMGMEGNRVGTEAVDTDAVLADFMVAPLEMTMQMHMVGLMYAPTDRITLMAMAPWTSMEMDHETRMGGTFKTTSDGIGDVKLSGLVGLKQEGPIRAHLNLGVSLPTGSIEAMGVTPMSMGNEVQLPYPMQIGSGTVDLLPGITFLGMSEQGSWGLQGAGTFRLGENDREWTLGNRLEVNGWVAYRLTDRISASARARYLTWGDVEGADPAFMNPMMVPTVRRDLRNGTRLEIPLGINYHIPEGALAGHRLAVEMALPVYQDLDGPQLETDWVLTVGWQKSFEPLGHGH